MEFPPRWDFFLVDFLPIAWLYNRTMAIGLPMQQILMCTECRVLSNVKLYICKVSNIILVFRYL